MNHHWLGNSRQGCSHATALATARKVERSNPTRTAVNYYFAIMFGGS